MTNNSITKCQRCKAVCKVIGPRNTIAKMLRRSEQPEGLCVNCAVHDWLRNTYPPNVLLAQSGPKILLYPHIQEQFEEIMRIGLADAQPDEINWELVVENWNLPFPKKIKPSATNPCNQVELEEIASGKRYGLAAAGIKPEKGKIYKVGGWCVASRRRKDIYELHKRELDIL